MTQSLGERQEEHESIYNYKLPRRVPIVIKAKLRNYKRLIQNLRKPYSPGLSEVMSQVAMYAISQIQDAVFGYCHNDEIVFILTNDKELDYQPWLSNNIQGIVSETSSFITNGFIKSIELFGDGLDLVGDAVFRVNVFSLPSTAECVNYIIHRQDSCIKNATNRACGFELEEKFGRDKASDLFKGKNYYDKRDMLQRFCGVEFWDYYPESFIYGTALYKVPSVLQKNDMMRNRWHIDDDLPNFIEDKNFISAIIANGADIFRAPDLENILDSEV